MCCTAPGSWLYASSMKNELSWMPLASGSEAIRGLCGGRRYATGQTDAIVRRNVHRKRERGNCRSFILAVNLATQPNHKHAPIVNATGCRLQKGRLRMRLRCNTLTADAGRILPV